jgi:hypothetical protein
LFRHLSHYDFDARRFQMMQLLIIPSIYSHVFSLEGILSKLNKITHITVQGNKVIMLGFSECSYDPLDGSAMWSAVIRDELVSEWRVYNDTEENCTNLGIAGSIL